MLPRIRSAVHLPSPAMVVAIVAVFLSLAGGAYALQGKNRVDSGDIKTGAVKRGDLSRDAVASGKVVDGSIKGADLGVNYYVQTASLTVPGNLVNSGTVSCNTGDLATGGGWNTGAPAPNTQNAQASYPAGPSSAPNGWTVVLDNLTTQSITNTIYVVCTNGGT